MIEVGLLNSVIRLKKESRVLSINVGGITMTSFFAFSEIYRFVKTYV